MSRSLFRLPAAAALALSLMSWPTLAGLPTTAPHAAELTQPAGATLSGTWLTSWHHRQAPGAGLRPLHAPAEGSRSATMAGLVGLILVGRLLAPRR